MVSSGDIAIVYVPCGTEEEAATIATTLAREGLIACGNIVVSRSIYLWQDRMVDEMEHLLICKTSQASVEFTRRRIEQLHSYDIPCIICVEPASVNAEYARWVMSQVTASRSLVAQSASVTHSEVGE